MQIPLGFHRQQLGKILVDMRLISEETLNEALMEQKLSGNQERLGALLLRRGLISSTDYVKALACQHQELVAAR